MDAHSCLQQNMLYMVGCILFAFRIQNRPATTHQLRTTEEKKTWHSVPPITQLTQSCTVRCYYNQWATHPSSSSPGWLFLHAQPCPALHVNSLPLFNIPLSHTLSPCLSTTGPHTQCPLIHSPGTMASTAGTE